jgi:hypothetical protein
MSKFIEVCWHFDEEYIPVRGHVDLATFNRETWAYGYEPVGLIRHTYWRCVPDRTGEFAFRYVFDVLPGRGAFAVTVYDC